MSLLSPSSPIPRRSSLGKLVDQSTVLLMVSIGTLILLLALLILFHENANATKGYRLRKLEQQRSQLLLEEEVLKMQIAEEQALGKLQDDRRIQAMVPLTKPLYTAGESAVARRGERE